MPGLISLGDALHGRRERRVVVRDSDGTPRDEVVFIDGDRHDAESNLGDDRTETQKFLKIGKRPGRLANCPTDSAIIFESPITRDGSRSSTDSWPRPTLALGLGANPPFGTIKSSS